MSTRDISGSRLVIATLLLVSTLTIMADTIVSPALPAMRTAFAGTENVELLTRLVVTMPAIAVTVTAPLAGRLVDRVGRKPVVLTAVVIYAVAGSAPYVLGSLVAILASRLILGIGVGALLTTATVMIADYFTTEQRDTVMGWQGATITFAGVLFLPVAGVLTGISWRVPFLVYAVPILLVPLIVVTIEEPELYEEMCETGDRPLRSLARVKRLVGRLPHRTLTLIYALALISQSLFYVLLVEGPFYLEMNTGVGSTLIGIALASTALFAAISSSQLGKIKQWLGIPYIVALGFSLLAVGFGVLSAVPTYAGIVIGFSFCGLGTGLFIPTLNTWIASEIPATIRGSALGGLTSVIFLGQFITPLWSDPASNLVDGVGSLFGVIGFVGFAFALGFVGIGRIQNSAVEQE